LVVCELIITRIKFRIVIVCIAIISILATFCVYIFNLILLSNNCVNVLIFSRSKMVDSNVIIWSLLASFEYYQILLTFCLFFFLLHCVCILCFVVVIPSFMQEYSFHVVICYCWFSNQFKVIVIFFYRILDNLNYLMIFLTW
jgi:hypothetical protein